MLRFSFMLVVFIGLSGCEAQNDTARGAEADNMSELCLRGVTYYVFRPDIGTSATRAIVRADDIQGKPIPCDNTKK